MGDPVTSGILAGGSILGGLFGKGGAKKSAKAQLQASREAIAEQRRQFDTLLGLSAPGRAIGNQALAALGSIYGYAMPGNLDQFGNPIPQTGGYNELNPAMFGRILGGPGGIQIPGINGMVRIPRNPATIDNDTGQVISPANYENFFASPDFRFRRDQGIDALQQSAAARGGLYSGNTGKNLIDYGQNMAAGEFADYFNRQAALAGIGQTATNQAGNAALQTGANVGNLLMAGGNARASGIADQYNAIGQGLFDAARFLSSANWGGGGNQLDYYYPIARYAG